MRTFVRVVLAAAIAVGLSAPDHAAAASKDPLKAGAASADITPPIGTPMFAYTDRSRVFGPQNNTDLLQVLADPDQHLYAKTFIPSKGFHTRLKTHSVVIDRNGETYALSQVDLGGIPFSVTKAVATKIARTGITQDRLLISATHTHAGHGAIWPWEDNTAYGFVGGDVFDKRVFDLTVDGIAQSILDAYDKRETARVGVASTSISDASRNRATDAFALNPEAADKSFTTNDQELTVIRVDSRSGRPIAVWSNFAVHATSIGDPILAGDNPGAAARLVEKAIGKGAVSVWTNGNEGDISPNTGPSQVAGQQLDYVNGSIAGSHMAGLRVARGILHAWEEAGEHLSKDIDLMARQAFLPFDGTQADGEPVGPIPVLGNGGIAAPDGTCAPLDSMAGPGQGKKLFLFGAPKIIPDVAPVSIWKVGDLGILATPSEITRTMGARIRNAVKEAAGGKVDNVIMAGLTDGYLSYTATPEEYDACGYEGAMTLFGRRQGPRYRDFARGLSAHVFTGAPAPAGAPEPAQTGLGVDNTVSYKDTPDAGTAVAQPAEAVRRFDRATFRWKGGDRALESQRGKAWIRLQLKDGNDWETVATDDTLADLVMRVGPETYEETYMFSRCEPRGTYRFQVTGRASKDGSVEPYTLTSRSFELKAATIDADAPAVTGTVATLRARYPNPGENALIVLPRLVTKGTATLMAGGQQVTAKPDAATGAFKATVPAGSKVTLKSLEDGCGNAAG